MKDDSVLRAPLQKMVKQEAVSIAVAHELLTYLLSGVVKVGGRLPSERELAEQLGVSRSAVREALKPFALLGIVDIRQGAGTFLVGTDSDLLPRVIEWGLLIGEKTVSDLVEARRPIELALVQLAAERRSESALSLLRQDLQRMQQARNLDDYAEADTQFHLHLAEAGGNAVLFGILDSIRSLLGVWIRRVVGRKGETSQFYDEHLRIFEAVERGDSGGAARAMEDHMESVTDRLRSGLEETTEDGAPFGPPLSGAI
jgi:GntR family transcriptional repressor for pyruvate dehydrogenase complex